MNNAWKYPPRKQNNYFRAIVLGLIGAAGWCLGAVSLFVMTTYWG